MTRQRNQFVQLSDLIGHANLPQREKSINSEVRALNKRCEEIRCQMAELDFKITHQREVLREIFNKNVRQ